MALNRSLIGKTYPGTNTYEISREKIRDFADALGDPTPAYRDVEAAKALGHSDVLVPPTFLTAAGFRLGGGPTLDPELGINYALVMHGEQRYVTHRPLRPGDVLTHVQTISDIRDAGRNEVMTVATEYRTTDGELVAEGVTTLVSRGTGQAVNA